MVGSKKSNASGNGFQSLGLSDSVFRGIVRMGFRVSRTSAENLTLTYFMLNDCYYQMPTPVQRKALPVILSGSDTIVMARTGSGKTAAFLIPLLEKLQENQPNPTSIPNKKCRAIILSPTRELSLQTLKVMNKISHFLDIKSIGIHGGEGMEKQFNALASKPDVIIATPGRLAHHLSEIPDFDLKLCQMCILDEADRLLEMGFTMQIRQISSTLPDYCQKVLLSATMPRQLIEFTKSGFTTDPQVVRLDQEACVSSDLRMAFITCRSSDKEAALLHVLDHIERDKTEHESNRTGLTLIFAATRHHVEYITTLLTASGIQSTLVYGTLDQEARKGNLSAFRTGKKPVLVVTDVAARGIDVPLIDHVIHYAFPSSAKLFIHRSGRAARAGRIGYCWSLVEPEEMPYMVDLHLHLGRKLSTGRDNDNEDEEKMYTLNEMTPDQVHYGSVPESILNREVENVRRFTESELTGSNQAETLRALTRVCNNAMKQYRKTRPEASKEGSRRAKEILEGKKLENGKRIGSAIPSHPLLRGMERKDFLERKSSGADKITHCLDAAKKREEFLRNMSNFRPKETIFEAFATGGGKKLGVVSQVDKGRTSDASKSVNNAAFDAMKNMRRQMRIAHDKGSCLFVAGTKELDDGAQVEKETSLCREISRTTPKPSLRNSKPRVSKAARKREKKHGRVDSSQCDTVEEKKKTKNKRGEDFRDKTFFIENDFTSDPDEARRLRQNEASMQPSAANVKGAAGAALRLEEAVFDIVGDEQADLAQKQRMMRWDKSKRKYVTTTVGTELSGESKSKKLRLESGQLVKSDRMKLGELYEKWQKKTNRSIGRTGVFDDADNEDISQSAPPSTQNAGWRAGSEEVKSARKIYKERKKKQNLKLKNMKRSDRRRNDQKQQQFQKRGHK